jgi:two-component system CheB/CheR fusion protein
MIRLELEAVNAPRERYRLSGPRARLGFDLVQTMSLALHELTTNAVKHGALGNDTGRLEVSWTIDDVGDNECRLTLHWRESGVKIGAAPVRHGFGRELIEKAHVHTHRARTTLEFKPDGVECTIEVTFGKATSRTEAAPVHA